MGTALPLSSSRDVTVLSAIPQGTIRPKWSRLVPTLSANPWLVTQRAIRTPIAASFASPTHTPVSPADAARVTPKSADGANQHFLEVAHVAVHVAAIRIEVDDRIADELTRAVIGDVAAAPGLDELDAPRGSASGVSSDVRSIVPRLDAERDDRRMLQEQQLIADRAGFSLLDQLPLQLQRVGVGDEAEAPDVRWRSRRRGRRHGSGPAVVEVLDAVLEKLRNRPASAPSTRRWS